MNQFDFDKNLKENIQKNRMTRKIIEPFIIADIGEVVVVKAELVEPEIHDNGGKQVHCPTFNAISCKHGHDVFVQFVVKQPTKFYIIYLSFL